MRRVGIWGLRGGVGTTSIVAMVGDALHQMGSSVLLVDLNPSDTLRLQFNVPYADTTGWAHALASDEPWYEHAFQVEQRMHLLPYGRRGLPIAPDQERSPGLPATLGWIQEIARLKDAPDWVLFDTPQDLRQHPELASLLHVDLMVASVDAGCHILLSQTALTRSTRIIANQHDPSRTLCNDILVDWTGRHQGMLPVIIGRDESIHEALALKSPVTRAFPGSSASQDAHTLATWLHLHLRHQK